MEQQAIANLIEQAKQGDAFAKNQIVRLMQENHYIKIISKYLYINRLLESEEVQGEFWLGVVLAMPKVKPDIGDPLFYLAWSGLNRVKKQLRLKIGKGVHVTCLDCDWSGRLYRKNKEYVCRNCGSINLETHQYEINLSTIEREETKDKQPITDVLLSTRPTQRDLDFKDEIEQFKTKLTPQELRVFILITEKEIDRDHEQNYLQTIANILEISAQCVNHYLGRIRAKMKKNLDGDNNQGLQ